LVSMKHRIVLESVRNSGHEFLESHCSTDYECPDYCVNCNKWAFIDNYGYCQKCYEEAYNVQQNESSVVNLLGTIYDVTICIYKKSPVTLKFVVKEIKNKLTLRNISTQAAKYQMFKVPKYLWWDYKDDFSKDIQRDFTLKIMIIRDFAPFDVWCYIVGLIIEGDLKREIVFM
jgi:hypothetical protein